MAFFEGGRIPTVGVTPQFIGNTTLNSALRSTLGQAASIGVNQVFQGSGQSLLAGPGQAVATVLAENVVNIGLNSLLGSDISSVSGVDLASGQNFLAPTLTSSLTPLLASAVNDSLQTTLASAGPFGSVFSNLSAGLVGSLFSNPFGGAAQVGGELEADTRPSQRFPGARDEPSAVYGGGSSYTLGNGGPDVVFSLQPANQGPQMFGQQFLYDSKVGTKLGFTQYENIPNSGALSYAQTQDTKLTEMLGDSVKLSNYDFAAAYNPTFETSTFNADGGTMSVLEQQPSGGWTFICAPEDINWDIANAANRVDMFGTNNPPVVAGTKGMIDLSIGNALVEGFTRRVSVQDKIESLQALMNYSLNGSDGFVSVPVYQFWANERSYGSQGTDQGFFIIRDVKVSEKMRDLSGDATRATVDVSLMQVPKYQVNTGRDSASEVTTGAKSALLSKKDVKAQAAQAKAKAGPGAGKAAQAAKAATGENRGDPRAAQPIKPTQ